MGVLGSPGGVFEVGIGWSTGVERVTSSTVITTTTICRGRWSKGKRRARSGWLRIPRAKNAFLQKQKHAYMSSIFYKTLPTLHTHILRWLAHWKVCIYWAGVEYGCICIRLFCLGLRNVRVHATFGAVWWGQRRRSRRWKCLKFGTVFIRWPRMTSTRGISPFSTYTESVGGRRRRLAEFGQIDDFRRNRDFGSSVIFVHVVVSLNIFMCWFLNIIKTDSFS